MCLLFAIGLWLGIGTSAAKAEEQAPKPVIVQVSVGEPTQPSVPDDVEAPPMIPMTGCPSSAPSRPHNIYGDSSRSWVDPFLNKLCPFLSYKPLPVPPECQGKCCHSCCGSCTPRVYAFFVRHDGCCAPCGGGCQQGCGCGGH